MKRLTSLEFIQISSKIHNGKYDYSEIEFKNKSSKVKIRCIEHGTTFYQIPRLHMAGSTGCKECINHRRKMTNLKNHGVEYPLQSSNIKNKVKKTCIKKYGFDNPSKSTVVRKKIKNTNMQRLGVEHQWQSKKIQDKVKTTMRKRHGVDNPQQSNKIKEKTKKTNIEKYGMSCPIHTPDNIAKRKLENIKKYGNEHPSQSHIDPVIIDKLKDENWLYDQHIINKRPLCVIADDLGINESTIGRYLHNHNIETHNYYRSAGENEVATFIKSLNIEIIQNTRKIIPPYELDIYIPEHKLAIEYCGLYWHSEQAGKSENYHRNKLDMCNKKGIQLITMFESEWKQRQSQIKNKLRSLLHCNSSETIYARKTNIVHVTKKQKQKFFNNNHIQADGPGSINIGLMCDDLVACMSFIKINRDYELRRYATSCHVPGGFTKLLKFFIDSYEPKSIISFADLRWSNGNMYLKTGWEIDKILKPDYYYSPDGKNLFHKFNYRRKNLSKLLDNFDESLSEKINCDNNGILRIWDCGKIKFKKLI